MASIKVKFRPSTNENKEGTIYYQIIQNRVIILLTLYVARHSWASIAKSKNIPISVISEGMGHDSEMTTQIYLASLDNVVVDRANAQILKDL